jgi:hypothetical protein
LARLKSGSMLLADRGYDGDWIRELAIEKAHGPTSRQKAIAAIRSASALISTAPATGSRGSSIGSSNAVGSRRATTSLPRITSPSSNLRQSGCGGALLSLSLRAAKRRRNPFSPPLALRIASRSLSSGGASAPTRWLAMTMWKRQVRQNGPTGKSTKVCPALS